MDARRRRPRGLQWIALVPLLLVRPLAASEPLALAVADERCDFVLERRRDDDKYVLVVSSLARGAGPYRIELHAEGTAGPAALPLLGREPSDALLAGALPPASSRRSAGGDKPRPSAWSAREYSPLESPPRERTFHVFIGAHDFHSSASYATVRAELQALGKHCQVYVDGNLPDAKGLKATVTDAVRVFDDEVYPSARRLLGSVLDVDRDGRFTILFTPRLAQLAHAQVSLGGFIRGSDFYRDLQAPFGNRCDLMYLNSDLKPGPFLHSLIAHEYTHAVIFSEHVFADHEPAAPHTDEESWLNEALAHLTEDLNGYGWCNLDYRISAFLSDPGRYQLVVPDYYGAGLWRSAGNRGNAYLFLRWCVERYGLELVTRLIQTNRVGVANLEAATGKRFPDLFRDWTTSLVLAAAWKTDNGWIARLKPPKAALVPAGPDHAPFTGHHCPTRLWCGPRFIEMSLAGSDCAVSLAGTSPAYVLLHSLSGPASRVTVLAEPGAGLQVSLVPLPPESGRLGLRVQPGPARSAPRLLLTAFDKDLLLTGAAWERRVPVERRAEDSSYRPGTTEAAIRCWFGDSSLRAGESRLSEPIEVPGTLGVCIFKVTAVDAGGHPVAAWAELPPTP